MACPADIKMDARRRSESGGGTGDANELVEVDIEDPCMSGELQILLLVLLSVTLGSATLIYYLRKQGRTSHVEHAPSTRGSTSRDRNATELVHKDHKQDASSPTGDYARAPDAASHDGSTLNSEQPELAHPDAESEDVSTSDVAQTTKEVAPDIETADGLTGGPEVAGLTFLRRESAYLSLLIPLSPTRKRVRLVAPKRLNNPRS